MTIPDYSLPVSDGATTKTGHEAAINIIVAAVNGQDAAVASIMANVAAAQAKLTDLEYWLPQDVSWTTGKFTHKTTGVETAGASYSFARVPVSAGQRGRISSRLSGDAGQVAALVFLNEAGGVISSALPAEGAAKTLIFSRREFTVPALCVEVAYNILAAEEGTALVELRDIEDASLAAALDQLGAIASRATGYAPLTIVQVADKYWKYDTGVLTAGPGWVALEKLPVSPGETLKISGAGAGTATAKVVYLNPDQTFHSYVSRNAVSVSTWNDDPLVVPSGAGFACFSGYGAAPVIKRLGFAGATLDELKPVADSLSAVLAAGQGFAPAAGAITVGKYWAKGTGAEITLGSTYRTLAPVAVTPGEKIRITCVSTGAPTALVVWRDAGGAWLSYTDRITDAGGEVTNYNDFEVTVPAGAYFALLDSYGTDPVLKKLGFAPATLDDVAEATVPLARVRTTADFWAGKKILWLGTSIPAGAGANAYPPKVAARLGATVVNNALASSAVRIGLPEGVGPGDPYGWTGMNYNNLIRSLAATQAEKQEFIDDYLSKWKALVTGGPTAIGAGGTPSEAEILAMSYEARLTPHLDADLFVIDHLRNDAAISAGGVSGSEVATIPGVDVTVDANGDPVTTRDRRWGIGAINYLIDVILASNPRARIVFVGHYENDRDPYIAQAQQWLANHWRFPIIPLWSLLGWSTQPVVVGGVTTTLLDVWLPDDVHPASDGTGASTDLIAEALAPRIRDIR